MSGKRSVAKKKKVGPSERSSKRIGKPPKWRVNKEGPMMTKGISTQVYQGDTIGEEDVNSQDINLESESGGGMRTNRGSGKMKVFGRQRQRLIKIKMNLSSHSRNRDMRPQ